MAKHMTMTDINRLLPAGYSAKFERADDGSMDSSLNILLHGQPTRWALQIGGGYFGVNEYGFEEGKMAWMQDHGYFRTLRAAVARLSALLSQGVEG